MLRQVAHALLTRPPLSYLQASSPVTPFDLNVLCTPPAFILSQDQTLEYFVLYHPLGCNNHSSFLLASFTFCLSSILFRIFNEISFALYSHLFDQVRFVLPSISCCSIFNDRYSLSLKFYTASLLYHIRYPFVKYFFQLFSNFFISFFRPLWPSRLRP